MSEYSNSEITRVINEYIHHERNRKILLRRYIDGITLETLAEEFDLSVKQIKNIIYKNEGVIFKHLEETKRAMWITTWLFLHALWNMTWSQRDSHLNKFYHAKKQKAMSRCPLLFYSLFGGVNISILGDFINLMFIISEI